MKFELLKGTHSNHFGIFKSLPGKPPAIIESDSDLTKTFRNKFRRRLDLESANIPATKPIPHSPTTNLARRAKPETPAVAPADEGEEKDEGVLDRDPQPPAVPAKRALADESDDVPAVADETPAAVAAEAPAVTATASAFGVDVTTQFPDAAKAELTVFRDRGNRFHVVDPDKPGKALNPKGLSKKETFALISSVAGT